MSYAMSERATAFATRLIVLLFMAILSVFHVIPCNGLFQKFVDSFTMATLILCALTATFHIFSKIFFSSIVAEEQRKEPWTEMKKTYIRSFYTSGVSLAVLRICPNITASTPPTIAPDIVLLRSLLALLCIISFLAYVGPILQERAEFAFNFGR